MFRRVMKSALSRLQSVECNRRARGVRSPALRCGLFFARIISVCIATLPLGSAGAQVNSQFRTASRSLITQNIDRTQTTAIPGALGGNSFTDKGEADPTLPMEHVQLLLRRPAERQAAFDAAVEALHTPGSSSYHKWLTPSVIGAEF